MMEKINLENYEAYFLDFAEGNLTEQQLQMLESFLRKHPHLKSELEDFDVVTLEEVPTPPFALELELKREESTGLLLADYLMISEVEGTITKEEKAQLSELIRKSPEKMNQLATYHKTKLPQEQVVVFEGKSALLQKSKKGIIWWRYASSVAAAIVLLFLWNSNSTDELYSPRGFAWQMDESSGYNEPIQHRFVAQEKEVITADEQKTVGLKKEVGRAFANNVERSKVNSRQNKPKQEESIDPLLVKEGLIIEDEVAQVETPPKIEEERPNNATEVVPEKESYASNDLPTSEEEKFIPIKEFAKSKIKDDVLKGKTFSETILDEIAEVSNEKITFERKKDKAGNTQKFALNIGKFSISKNK